MSQFAGKVALITGGNTGIGRAAAIEFAKQGAQVVVSGRREKEGHDAIAEIKALGGEAIFIKADVSKASDVKSMIEQTLATFSRLDFAFNNAGVEQALTPLPDQTEETYDQIMDINVKGVWLSLKHEIPAMLKTGGGAIVNVSSISALRPRGLTAYSVSKGAVIALTRAMAVDHGPEGIRVNCVAPGPVYTPMVYQRGMSPASRDRRRKASALGIEGTGWDIGHAVRFLMSDFARYITGHTLVVDGGTSLSAPERDAGGSGG